MAAINIEHWTLLTLGSFLTPFGDKGIALVLEWAFWVLRVTLQRFLGDVKFTVTISKHSKHIKVSPKNIFFRVLVCHVKFNLVRFKIKMKFKTKPQFHVDSALSDMQSRFHSIVKTFIHQLGPISARVPKWYVIYVVSKIHSSKNRKQPKTMS